MICWVTHSPKKPIRIEKIRAALRIRIDIPKEAVEFLDFGKYSFTEREISIINSRKF